MNEAIDTPSGESDGTIATDAGESGWSNDQVEALRASIPEGMSPDGLAKSFKEMQGSKDKHLNTIKTVNDAFQAYGGAEQALQALDSIANDEKVLNAIREARSPQSDMDEDTKAALDMVRKELGPEQKAAIQKEMAPIQNALKQQELDKAVTRLNKDFGDNWKELEGSAAQILKGRGYQSGFATAEDIVGAFGEAAMRAGKFELLADAVNEKKLAKAKATGTDKPKQSPKESIPENAKGKDIYETVANALKIAKKSHKIEGEISF